MTVTVAAVVTVKQWRQQWEKNPEVYEQRSHVNKFEQRPEEIKFQSSMVVVKPKKVSGSTKAQMDTRIAKKKTKKSSTGIKIS